jgi:sugar phosphate isomerase/epimerase
VKLSVSNIAWDNNALEEHLALLEELECDGVEIAPSCIWKEPIEAGKDEIESLRKLVSKYSLVIPAFHALLFTRPDLYIFGDEPKKEQTISYLKRLIRLAGMLSVRVLVYGSPASRRVGDKSYKRCYEIAVGVFRDLGKEAQLNDTFFCIEPLGSSESDFIQTSDEGYNLVKDVDHPHFGLHLDTKAMINSGEDFPKVLKRYASIMKHLHVSDHGLAPPGYTGFDHSLIGKALSGTSYDGFISIEMKRGFGDTQKVVRDAVEYVRRKYFFVEEPGNA